MAEPKTHKIVLNNISAKYLHDLLQSTGWTRNTSDIILAGQVLVDKIPSSIEKDARKLAALTDESSFTEWAEKPVEFDLTEKQRETCKFVIEKFAKDGKVPTNKYGAMMIQAFGFSVEES